MSQPNVSIDVESPALEAPSAPDIAIVEVPQSDPAVLALAERAGATEALLITVSERMSALESRMDAVESTADTAISLSVEATDTAVTAVETVEAIEMTPEPEPESSPPSDEKPSRQHWAFRERDEWHMR